MIGSHGLEFKSVLGDEIPDRVRTFLESFKAERRDGEIFADWFARTRQLGDAPAPEQFHIELAERAARLEAAKAVPAE